MQDIELKIELENPDSTYRVNTFKCHTHNITSAVELAEKEKGFQRVLEILDDGRN